MEKIEFQLTNTVGLNLKLKKVKYSTEGQKITQNRK